MIAWTFSPSWTPSGDWEGRWRPFPRALTSNAMTDAGLTPADIDGIATFPGESADPGFAGCGVWELRDALAKGDKIRASELSGVLPSAGETEVETVQAVLARKQQRLVWGDVFDGVAGENVVDFDQELGRPPGTLGRAEIDVHHVQLGYAPRPRLG